MTSVQTIHLAYLESDDRLALDFGLGDSVETLLLTRRLTRRLIQGVAGMLAQPDVGLAHVPVSHQTEMLVWEHISARQPPAPDAAAAPAAPPARSPPRSPPPWPLLSRLDIQCQKGLFRLRFEPDNGASRALAMSRSDLHRLLASLRQLARRAGWDLDGDVDWLVAAESPTLQSGSLAS